MRETWQGCPANALRIGTGAGRSGSRWGRQWGGERGGRIDFHRDVGVVMGVGLAGMEFKKAARSPPMHLSFDRRTALMLLRHVGGKPTVGKRADRDVQVSASGGRLFIGNSYATAACDAVVLEPGGFWIQRTFLEKVLRSFQGQEIIVLEADSKRLTLGRFSCGILNDEPAPEPPTAFEFVATPGAVRLSGESV